MTSEGTTTYLRRHLALQALVAAFATNKAIVDESSTRTAIAEVTAE